MQLILSLFIFLVIIVTTGEGGTLDVMDTPKCANQLSHKALGRRVSLYMMCGVRIVLSET